MMQVQHLESGENEWISVKRLEPREPRINTITKPLPSSVIGTISTGPIRFCTNSLLNSIGRRTENCIHPINNSSHTRVCRYHLLTNCTREECEFEHPPELKSFFANTIYAGPQLNHVPNQRTYQGMNQRADQKYDQYQKYDHRQDKKYNPHQDKKYDQRQDKKYNPHQVKKYDSHQDKKYNQHQDKKYDQRPVRQPNNSNRMKSKCMADMMGKLCPYGGRCNFAHNGPADKKEHMAIIDEALNGRGVINFQNILEKIHWNLTTYKNVINQVKRENRDSYDSLFDEIEECEPKNLIKLLAKIVNVCKMKKEIQNDETGELQWVTNKPYIGFSDDEFDYLTALYARFIVCQKDIDHHISKLCDKDYKPTFSIFVQS
jgi:hypothetical protein